MSLASASHGVLALTCRQKNLLSVALGGLQNRGRCKRYFRFSPTKLVVKDADWLASEYLTLEVSYSGTALGHRPKYLGRQQSKGTCGEEELLGGLGI